MTIEIYSSKIAGPLVWFVTAALPRSVSQRVSLLLVPRSLGRYILNVYKAQSKFEFHWYHHPRLNHTFRGVEDVSFIDIRQLGLKPRPFNMSQLFFADEFCQFCAFAIRLLFIRFYRLLFLFGGDTTWVVVSTIFYFTPTWQNDDYFFKWVETINYLPLGSIP